MEGNIVVDGVVASCYASGHHDLGQIVMTPFLWFPWAIDWIFGEEKGFSVYAKTSEELGRLLMPFGL